MKRLAVIVTVLSIIALGNLAYGEMGSADMGHEMMPGCNCDTHKMSGPERPMLNIFAHLNLDEQQKTFIHEIKIRTIKDTIRKRAELRIAQIELKELLVKDPLDMNAVEAKLKQEETIMTELRLSHIRAMEEARAKLTPEQRKKLRQMIKDMPMMQGRGIMHEHRCDMKSE